MVPLAAGRSRPDFPSLRPHSDLAGACQHPDAQSPRGGMQEGGERHCLVRPRGQACASRSWTGRRIKI